MIVMVETVSVKNQLYENLNSLYKETTKYLFEKNNLKKALKFCEKGLKEAEKIGDKDWVKKFGDLRTNTIPCELRKNLKNYLEKVILKEKNLKYSNAIKDLLKAKENLKTLYRIERNEEWVSENLFTINEKIAYLEDQIKLDTSKHSIADSVLHLDEVVEIDNELISEIKDQGDSIENLEIDSQSVDVDKEFDRLAKEILKEKPQNFRQEIQEFEQEVKELRNEVKNNLQDFRNSKQPNIELNFQKSTSSKQQEIFIDLQDEILKDDRIRQLTKEVEECLKSSGFYVIPNSSSLTRNLFKDIDVFALKIVKISEDLNNIIIIPIKVNNLKGSLIISEERFDYKPYNRKFKLTDKMISVLVKPNVERLTRTQEYIFKDLTSEGKLFQFFRRYLKIDINVEKTKTNKRMFFRFGQLLCKILIEPILVCQNETASREKTILFPYLRSSNLHAIKIDLLPELVKFLVKKYTMIENYTQEESSVKSYFNSVSKLMADVRLYSIPFVVFGFVFLLAFVFQAYKIVEVLIALGYAAIAIYLTIILFLYVKFRKRLTELTKEFNTPYYQRDVNIDETDLIMINEELSNDSIDQFVYECFGKNVDFKIVSKIENDKTNRLISEKKPRNEKVVDSTFIDNQVVQKSFASKSLRNKLIEKYSSFLED